MTERYAIQTIICTLLLDSNRVSTSSPHSFMLSVPSAGGFAIFKPSLGTNSEGVLSSPKVRGHTGRQCLQFYYYVSQGTTKDIPHALRVFVTGKKLKLPFCPCSHLLNGGAINKRKILKCQRLSSTYKQGQVCYRFLSLRVAY